LNYYRRYVGDYARDTMSLSLTEHGAYALLLDAYYADEHPLPAKVDMLYRICRATTALEKAAVRAVAEKFFPVGEADGLRHNSRADRELGKAKTAIGQMSEAGREGAEGKWGKGREAAATRSQRLAAARAKGTHTDLEWSLLVEICGGTKCVRCAAEGVRLVKDHIVPIYQGGDDSIRNLQPLCSNCNSSKGADTTDHRPPGWSERLQKCLQEMPGVVSGGTPASTNHQPPTTSLQPPEPPTPKPQPDTAAAAERRAARELKAARNRLTREAFVGAYRRRWGVDPTWDAQANSMLSRFVDKVGIEDAPLVAAFYVEHPRQDYVRSKHDVALMLRDARGLRTEWATDRRVTDAEARQSDATGARADQASRFLRSVKP
jgi:uncharacterized protein YdaU (DUF1376 family)